MTRSLHSQASPAPDVTQGRTGNKRTSPPSGQKKGRAYRRITPKDRETFLRVLAGGWSFARAAAATGHTDRAWRDVRHRDEAFAVACHDAREIGVDKLEDALREVAYDGNVTALIFALKNMRPAVWRDRHDFTHHVPTEQVARFAAALSEIAMSSDPPEVRAERTDALLAEIAGEQQA